MVAFPDPGRNTLSPSEDRVHVQPGPHYEPGVVLTLGLMEPADHFKQACLESGATKDLRNLQVSQISVDGKWKTSKPHNIVSLPKFRLLF